MPPHRGPAADHRMPPHRGPAASRGREHQQHGGSSGCSKRGRLGQATASAAPNPGRRRRVVRPVRHPRRRRGLARRRVRRGQGHVLRTLPVQGSCGRRLAAQDGRFVAGRAPRGGPRGGGGCGRAAGGDLRRPPRQGPGRRARVSIHQHRGGVRARQRGVQRHHRAQAAVRAWVRELAGAAGAADPDALAVQFTLLIDGVRTAAPFGHGEAAAEAAREMARGLVRQSCPATPTGRRPRSTPRLPVSRV
jgi:hypothetical protein